MRYTIITPTLLRPSLRRLCASVDEQTNEDWQHIVVIDTLHKNDQLLKAIAHPQREYIWCGKNHNDWASTCRRSAWDHAKGDYLLYIDDDNYLADPFVLETLEYATDPVLLFPLLYRGEYNSPTPIFVGRSDTNQLMVKREIGIWPQRASRDTDGVFIVDLTRKHPYQVFEERALVVYEEESSGRRA